MAGKIGLFFVETVPSNIKTGEYILLNSKYPSLMDFKLIFISSAVDNPFSDPISFAFVSLVAFF